MDKILITLFVPSIREHFELRLPVSLSLNQLMPLLLRLIQENAQQTFTPSARPILCCKNPAKRLEENKTLAQYGISSGDELYLF